MLDADTFSGESLDALFAQETSLDSQVRLPLVAIEVGVVDATGSYCQDKTDKRMLLSYLEPFMTELYPYLLESFSDGSYPDMVARQEPIKDVIRQEEEIFMSTLSKGLALLEPVFKQKDLSGAKQVPADIAFKLYDTFGFPLDLTVLIAEERGWTVDLAAVEALKQKQREQGRASWKAGSSLVIAKAQEWKEQGIFPTFSGYHRDMLTGQSSTVLAAQSTDDGTGDMILSIEPCPFYGLGGGQSPDTGSITLANGSEWRVVDVFSPYERGLAIRVQAVAEETALEEDLLCMHKGFKLTTFVDAKRREGVAAHHSATHLLNAALRKTLGKAIMQAGKHPVFVSFVISKAALDMK